MGVSNEFFDEDKFFDEGDIYSEDAREEMVANGELSAAEAGFMRGVDRAG